MSDLLKDIEKAAKLSPFLWTVSNLNLPKGMAWDFSLRKWQIPILNSTATNQVTIKPAQVGLSTISLAKMLYLAYHIPMRVAYVLPRDKDYQDMVSTRADPIINSSDILRQRMVHSRTDSMSRKQIGDSFLHFLASSTEPRMLDIDTLIIDETDLSNQEYLDLYSARLFASKYKIHYNLSTPTTPNRGVDALIKQSTWNIWNVKCPYCGSWIPFDANWTAILKKTKHRIYYGYNCCDSCKDIGLTQEHIANGVWVPSYANKLIEGFQVVRTMDATTTAEELYRMWKTTRIERNFYTSGLGLPYVADSQSLDKDTVMALCLDGNVQKEEVAIKKGRYHVGIDQGNVLHMVVLKEADDDKLELVWAGIFDETSGNSPFNSAAKKAGLYNPSLVCDILPNTHSAKDLVRKFKNGKLGNYQFTLNSRENFFEDSKTNPDLVLIQKHEAIDEVVNKFIRQERLRFYSKDGVPDRMIEVVAEHIAALQRTVQTRKQPGLGEREFHVWEPNGPDHFAQCLVYATVSYLRSKGSEGKKFRWSMLG